MDETRAVIITDFIVLLILECGFLSLLCFESNLQSPVCVCVRARMCARGVSCSVMSDYL